MNKLDARGGSAFWRPVKVYLTPATGKAKRKAKR